MIKIEVSNWHDVPRLDSRRLTQAAESILRDAGVRHGELSIAIVDDATIHELNRRYLAHDYPTDALSFLLEREGDRLEGEVIVSVDTAARDAPEFGWSTADELLLYVIHGTLHLVGHDDSRPAERAKMRRAEEGYLAQFGLARRETVPAPREASSRHFDSQP